MRLYPFAGTRYRGPEAGRLAAPPFDQIDAERQAELHARDPHHFAHLTRPDSPERAAELLDRWADEGVIESDVLPALYTYEIVLAGGAGSRLGLCGLIGIEDPSAGVVRPHESTVDKTIHERLGLIHATRTDLEPILVLCEDSGEMEALLEREVFVSEALCEHEDEFGHVHRLRRIDDPEVANRFRELLAPRPVMIADGHHRYRVASEYARQTRPDEGTPAAAKLAVITSLRSSGLRIDPIHRALAGDVDTQAAGDAVVSRTPWSGTSGSDLAAAVADAPQPAIGVWRHGGTPEIWQLDPAAAPGDLPEGARRLAAAVLHGTLYERFGLPEGAATDGTTAYRSDPDQLWEQVENGIAGVGIWLPPTPPDVFAAAVEAGDRLPPKWTRFVPKLASGLIWCSHDSEGV
jgi:uncharacterized protein (DUF1015 family)